MQKIPFLLVVSALAAAASAQKAQDPFRAELGLYVPTFSGGNKDVGVNVGLGYSFLQYKGIDVAAVARGSFFHANQGGLGFDFSLGTYGVDARYRPTKGKFFVGVGLAAAQLHASIDDFSLGDATKLGYSFEAGYDLTKSLYGVVRFQDTTDSRVEVYRAITLGVGYRF